jgi:membrane protease YdiL (CAAX protease family)
MSRLCYRYVITVRLCVCEREDVVNSLCSYVNIVQLYSSRKTLQDWFTLPPDILGEQLQESLDAGDNIANGLYVAVVALLTPLWEEAIFRGFLLTSLARYLNSAWCIAISSAVFVAVHFALFRVPCALHY